MRPGVKEILTFHLFVEKEVNKEGEGRKRKAGKEGKRKVGLKKHVISRFISCLKVTSLLLFCFSYENENLHCGK